MARLKVVWIIGMAYSGSSLLNLLLDGRPRIRGIGEGAIIYFKGKQGGPCAKCHSTAADCEIYRPFTGTDFYAYTAAAYGDVECLVDSSKHARWVTEHARIEPGIEYFALLLSKTPHEQAYSLLLHDHWDIWGKNRKFTAVSVCFDGYVNVYTKYLTFLRGYFGDAFGERVLPVHYRDVAASPDGELERICSWLDLPFDDTPIGTNWNRTNTHILGGNPAIIAEVSQDDELAFAVPRDQYLGGKYVDHQGAVVLDENWKSDRGFVAQCAAEYPKLEHANRLLTELGHDTETLRAELNTLQMA